MSEMQQATQGETQPQRDPAGTLLNQPSTETETTETQPSSTQTEPTEDKSLLDTDKPTIPEKYEFTPPKDWADKGFELDAKILDEATPMLKELGLSQSAAQRLVEFYATQSMKQYEDGLAAARKQNDDWRAEAHSHPDLKGRLDPGGEVVTRISKVIDSLGPELAKGFREAMNYTGVGNHPSFIRAFDKIAQRLSEGTNVTGGKPSPLGQRDPSRPGGTPAQRIWPNLPSG